MSTPALTRWARRVLRALGELWQIAGLDRVRVESSPRMRRSLGRCDPDRGLIRLNPALLERDNRDQLRETLVHEAAHVAAHRLARRRREPPHGPTWRALMRSAGYAPRATAAPGAVTGLAAARPARFEHRCRDCGVRFFRRRTDRRWRCAACLGAGRPGRLAVVVHKADAAE